MAGTAIDELDPGPASEWSQRQNIIGVTTDDRIEAVAAPEKIGPVGVSGQNECIVAAFAEQPIVARPAGEHVVFVRADQLVVGFITKENLSLWWRHFDHENGVGRCAR